VPTTLNPPRRMDAVRACVRFPLHLDITVSTPERDYHAITEDVSANGVLFASEEVPEIDARVTFKIKMPAAIMGGQEDVLLYCIGRIVRHKRTSTKNMAAAVIDEYSLKAEHA
jgi:hypothetical protein